MYNELSRIIMEFVRDHVLLESFLIFLGSVGMLLAMSVDLVCGIRKARENGEATTSQGLKKTCEKARKYFTPYLVLICIDLLTSVVLPLPILSLSWACWCIFCEFKSVQEKAWKKAELRKAEKTMNIVIENKDDIAKLVAKLLMQSSTEAVDIVETMKSKEHESK